MKPAKAGDSLGVDETARVADAEALRAQVAHIQPEYPELLVEEFIEGREFTVLVIGDAEGHGRSIALTPVEYRFPEGRSYKSYALKTSELHPDANVPVREEPLASQLKDAARTVFRSFDATGYARMDFRMDAAGRLYFLEINFTCSVFYPEAGKARPTTSSSSTAWARRASSSASSPRAGRGTRASGRPMRCAATRLPATASSRRATSPVVK